MKHLCELLKPHLHLMFAFVGGLFCIDGMYRIGGLLLIVALVLAVRD